MRTNVSPCGCAVIVSDFGASHTISRCSLHDSAPELLAALKRVRNFLNIAIDENVEGSADARWHLDQTLKNVDPRCDICGQPGRVLHNGGIACDACRTLLREVDAVCKS
jgi:hypothetical protein